MVIMSEEFPAIVETPKLKIRHVGSEASTRWLEKGIADFKTAPMVSFSYGMIYVLSGLVFAWLFWRTPQFIAAMAVGFLLIGPIVAVGFYCMSRSIEAGNKPSFSQGLNALRFNTISLISFALVLAILMGIWTVISSITIALSFGNITVGEDMFDTLINHNQPLPFLLAYFVGGGMIALVAFVISVVSVPLITDKKVDFVTAILVSMQAVRENLVPMISWAAIIVTLMLLGYLFFFVGLAVTLPIVGHASWHAYRDLVGE
jgi:uncharacterized membrane protein